MAGDRCNVLGCRSYADTEIVIDQGLKELRARYFPPEQKKKKIRVCNNHQKSIMIAWSKGEFV